MSTRVNIVLHDSVRSDAKEVILYYGHDGYPEWLGAVLANVCRDLKQRKFYFSPSELATFLVKYGVMVDKDGVTKLYNDFQVSQDFHGDIEYVYTIFCHESKGTRLYPHGYLLNAFGITCRNCKPDWNTQEEIKNKDILYTSPYFDKVSIEHWWEKEPEIQQTEEQLKTLNSKH